MGIVKAVAIIAGGAGNKNSVNGSLQFVQDTNKGSLFPTNYYLFIFYYTLPFFYTCINFFFMSIAILFLYVCSGIVEYLIKDM